MRTIWTVALAALLLALPGFCGGTAAGRPDDPDAKKTAELMQRKLRESQKVLEGVAMGKYDDIASHAEELIEVSKAASFRVLKTPRYELYSKEFQQTAQALVKNANDKNLDAAALSYVELTLTCVKCHKYVREERMAWLDR
jgi:hypothetical protein